MIYLHAEDACDILNLHSGPPAQEARKSILSLVYGIRYLHEEHDRRALMAGTPRITYDNPTHKQILHGIYVPEKSMSSLYYTPHNEIVVHIPTPKPMPNTIVVTYPTITTMTTTTVVTYPCCTFKYNQIHVCISLFEQHSNRPGNKVFNFGK